MMKRNIEQNLQIVWKDYRKQAQCRKKWLNSLGEQFQALKLKKIPEFVLAKWMQCSKTPLKKNPLY